MCVGGREVSQIMTPQVNQPNTDTLITKSPVYTSNHQLYPNPNSVELLIEDSLV